jgi:hypothetical protein
MSHDISHILREWSFKQDDMVVRLIEADDGRQVLQMRVDLGLLQMEIDRRPDGLRPNDCDSWFDFYQDQKRKHDEMNPEGPEYLLGAEDCARLWHEGVQYYHRYLAFWHLDMYEPCARDTGRNLELFQFVRDHAADNRHKLQFDQWRPYVLMMHTRARAMPVLKEEQFAAGLKIIESGIDAIRVFLDDYGQLDRAEECVELASLEQWREEVIERDRKAAESQPDSALGDLRRRLDEAVAAEQFEEAARLRDEIRRLHS